MPTPGSRAVLIYDDQPTVVLAAPGLGGIRQLVKLSVYNSDVSPQTVAVQAVHEVQGDQTVIRREKQQIAAGAKLEYAGTILDEPGKWLEIVLDAVPGAPLEAWVDYFDSP